jgi:hypothetical protein
LRFRSRERKKEKRRPEKRKKNIPALSTAAADFFALATGVTRGFSASNVVVVAVLVGVVPLVLATVVVQGEGGGSEGEREGRERETERDRSARLIPVAGVMSVSLPPVVAPARGTVIGFEATALR